MRNGSDKFFFQRNKNKVLPALIVYGLSFFSAIFDLFRHLANGRPSDAISTVFGLLIATYCFIILRAIYLKFKNEENTIVLPTVDMNQPPIHIEIKDIESPDEKF
jgi:hypothetical protein